MKGLIEGRIVHYVPENTEVRGTPGWHRAAIVNMAPLGDKGKPVVSLTVFNPDGTDIVGCAPYDQTGQTVGSWHWIEGTNEALKAEAKE